MNCDECRCSLVTTTIPEDFDSSFHLLQLKNNGGLVIPSSGTVKVVMLTERILRQTINLHKTSNFVQLKKIEQRVVSAIGTQDVFNLASHIPETQNGIDNHHFILVRLISSTFCILRQHHITRLHSLKLQQHSVRHTLTKTILFKGH